MSKFWEKRTVGPFKAIDPYTSKVITIDPQRDAMIRFDYSTELKRQGGLLSWWLAVCDRAEEALRDARHEEHNVSEDIDDELREKHSKMTETALKMKRNKDPRMRKAFRVRMDAETLHNRLKSAVKAIEAKGFALQGLIKRELIERSAKDSM